MEEDKVVLDRRSFEALAVDSRVRILKLLKARRKTLSELADELGMSVSGVKEHLGMLERADLIKKMDDGHKWKYYELTKKGGEIMAPKELKVWVLLSIAMMALVVSMLAMLPSAPFQYDAAASAPTAPAPNIAPKALTATYDANSGALAANVVADNVSVMNNPSAVRSMNSLGAGAASPSESANKAAPAIEQDNGVPLLVGGVSILTIIACVGILIWNRMKPASA